MKFSTYARSKFNSLLSYIDAVKSLGKMDTLAEETKGVSQFDLNSGSSKFQHYFHLLFQSVSLLLCPLILISSRTCYMYGIGPSVYIGLVLLVE
jgi:hypothetical protein